MRAWLGHHARSIVSTLANFGRAPLGAALSVLVAGIALALPAGLYLTIDNLQSAARGTVTEPQISVFLALDASRAEVAQIETHLKQDHRVQHYRFVPRDQALRELKQASGIPDLVDSLPQNPLPDAFVVSAQDSSPQSLEALRDEIKQWPRVALVQLDAAWARRLDAVLRFGQLAVALLAALLACALIAIMFNNIRLQVLTRRDEIEVAKLIGATDAFIRRPFLYYGALQGCAGGALAWLVVSACVWLANRQLGELSHLYAALFQLRYLSAADSLWLLGLPAALGWLGAWMSVHRHLQLLEPPRPK